MEELFVIPEQFKTQSIPAAKQISPDRVGECQGSCAVARVDCLSISSFLRSAYMLHELGTAWYIIVNHSIFITVMKNVVKIQ